jgi:hypothetical protein
MLDTLSNLGRDRKVITLNIGGYAGVNNGAFAHGVLLKRNGRKATSHPDD